MIIIIHWIEGIIDDRFPLCVPTEEELGRKPIKPLRGVGPGSNPSIKKNESRVRFLFLSIPVKYVKMNGAFQHILGRYGAIY